MELLLRPSLPPPGWYGVRNLRRDQGTSGARDQLVSVALFPSVQDVQRRRSQTCVQSDLEIGLLSYLLKTQCFEENSSCHLSRQFW